MVEWLDVNPKADREAFEARHQELLAILRPLEDRIHEVITSTVKKALTKKPSS